MTNEDIKELGLPNYEEIQRAFMETDHYNHCHRSGIEWQDGAEWMRGIAIDAIKKKEKEMIDKACEWLSERCAFGVHPCSGTALVMEFRKVMEEEI